MAKRTTRSGTAAQGGRDEGLALRYICQEYLAELKAIRDSGAGVPETSYYPALAGLFNAVGKLIKPKVRCIIHTRDQGGGIPDGGLFTDDQFQRQADGTPKAGQLPARGAVEAKGTGPDVRTIAASRQVQEYLNTYGIVVVTNLREFLIVERGPGGEPVARESFALAESEDDFWRNKAAHPVATAGQCGEPFVEFLKRACLHNAPLVRPKDVAWFLASYARDALFRIEQKKELPALQSVRSALEEALGMQFTGPQGEHFFRSTLVQTLFYGVFSAWVRWHKDNPAPGTAFDWRNAEWSLHVPFIRVLYEEVARASRLGPLRLVEVLDWTASVLNHVGRAEFFQNFEDEYAVQYFYEPFLEAYDPELRKALGVWYTPPEIVKYQVARVDRVLREELDLPDGLADPNVIVLDPCCGTGAYLVEVLHSIADTLRAKGGDALVASDLKRASMDRVFGFEIMPAPFVVSHLQLSSLLQNQGAPLAHGRDERVGVYLTNSLTGWTPADGPQQQMMAWAELQQERDAAEHVKRDKRILVVLGNPPYNAFAGISPEEEQGIVDPYKENLNTPVQQGGWGIRKFNLDDLYVRFFRLAERRIAEMSGRGVVSFISNHSWLSDPSFVVLRKHLFDSFDKFWIENLHGNRKISEYAPDGRTSETVFAIRGVSAGIQQGVATSLWVKSGKPRKRPAQVRFRDDINDAKAEARRKRLLKSLSSKSFNKAYTLAKPRPENRFSFRPENVAKHYVKWPRVLDLCAIPPFNGLMEKRGGALIDVDRAALEARMRDYFDAGLSWDEYKARHAALTKDAARYNAKDARARAVATEPFDGARLRRYALRPFDTRWCYYTPVRPVWNEPRPALWAQSWEQNAFLMTRPAGVATPEGTPFCFTRALGDNDALRGHAYYVPLRLLDSDRLEKQAEATLFAALGDKPLADEPVANLSPGARRYLESLRFRNPDDASAAALIWLHTLAIGFSPAYLRENADGIRRDWPRIPLPATCKALEASAVLGNQLAALLDTETEVPGVTCGTIGPVFRTIGCITKVGGGQLDASGEDLAVTAGWGHFGKSGVVMPAKGTLSQRAYAPDEAAALDAEPNARDMLGETTCDVYLNQTAYWRNVPRSVWETYIGGYQVIKKWLSYREKAILGRAITPDEAREVTHTARRLAAIVLLQPKLDANYLKVKEGAFDWETAERP